MHKHILGALCALSAGIAQAETDLLAPVVVTATRNATPLEHIPASVTVIDQETIAEAQANDIGELLRGVAGIDLGRNGGPGQTTSVFLRGTESDHTLVLIDGVTINPGTLGNPALQNIDPRMIERIEIVRGPLSSLYGSSAIGGVINIITRTDPEQGSGSHFAAQGGNYNSLSLNTGAHWADQSSNLALNLSHQTSDGFPSKRDSSVDRGFRNDTLNARFGHRSGNHELQLQAFAATGNSEYLSGTPVDQAFENRVLRAGLTSQLSEAWQSRLTFSQMADLIDQNQANYLGDYDYAHTIRYSADWQHDYRLSANNRLVAGVTLDHEDIDALSYGTAFDIRLDNQAFYLQDQYLNGAHTANAAMRLTRHDSFGDHLTWNLGYAYQLSEATRLRASAGTAFRAPSASDLFGYGANPALEPEQSHSIEIGLSHRLDQRSSLDLAIYRNRVRNLITTNYYDLDGIDNGYPFGSLIDDPLNENVARATISGVELAYHYALAPWQFDANAEWKQPKNDADGGWLLRRARVSGKASLRYIQPSWDAGLDVQFVGKRADISAITYLDTTTDAYTLVNSTARWYASRQLTVEGRIENLFDADYELASGYNTPGRSLYLGIRVESAR